MVVFEDAFVCILLTSFDGRVFDDLDDFVGLIDLVGRSSSDGGTSNTA